MDEDFGMINELTMLASNIQKQMYIVFDSFLLFYIWKKIAHKRLFLMLDPRFKNLRLISSLIGWEQGIFIVWKFDMRSLFPMVLKCCQHLHFVVEIEIKEQNIDVESNLDIFEMTINCNEPMRELVNRELLSFRHYPMKMGKKLCKKSHDEEI